MQVKIAKYARLRLYRYDRRPKRPYRQILSHRRSLLKINSSMPAKQKHSGMRFKCPLLISHITSQEIPARSTNDGRTRITRTKFRGNQMSQCQMVTLLTS